MSFAKSENKSHQANDRTTANPAAGEKGISMPAVPVLQNQPAQLPAAEQEDAIQTQAPIELQHQYADKDKRENVQPFQLAAKPAPVTNTSAPNNTGLPDGLKKGVESLSGFDISDVKVHYNSPKPAQLQAFAYAQGTDIHVAPGQEKHLPHEAWHVVQQKQGRVQPTVQMKADVAINDDLALEREATTMGTKAAQLKFDPTPFTSPMQLQSGFGNAGVVQREVHNVKVEDPESEEGKKAREFFTYVNERAQEAYKYAMSVPSLGALSELDGYTLLWKKKWDIFIGGGAPALMAATFGYVVESLVSNGSSPFRPVSPPAGCTIYYQVTVGGTRPDLVLRLSSTGKDIAWVDLTADSSVDHIFNKDNWDAKVARYAEVSYPSLDPGSLSFMRLNKDNMGTLSSEEFAAKKEAARRAYALKKNQWLAMGEKYKYGAAKKDIDIDQGFLILHPEFKKDIITSMLKRDFNEGAINEKLVPSILAAMGVDAGPWGFTTGSSGSVKAGDAWLTDHDPALVEEKKSKPGADGEGKNETMDEEPDGS
jgi:hypothetical protein